MVWCIQKPIQPTEPDRPRVCILDRKHEELWRNLGHVLYIRSFHLGKSIIHVHWKQAWRRWIVLIDIDMACVWNVSYPFRCWDVVKAAFWLACLVLHALSVDASPELQYKTSLASKRALNLLWSAWITDVFTRFHSTVSGDMSLHIFPVKPSVAQLSP